jgi:hypothetical protein
MGAEQPNHSSLLEIYIIRTTIPIIANPERFVDLLHAIKLDEQRSTPCHENEAEKQSAKRKAGCDRNAVQFSFGLSTLNWRCRVVLNRGWCCSGDMVVVLRGDRRTIYW